MLIVSYKREKNIFNIEQYRVSVTFSFAGCVLQQELDNVRRECEHYSLI